jgi:hypothetical protein
MWLAALVEFNSLRSHAEVIEQAGRAIVTRRSRAGRETPCSQVHSAPPGSSRGPFRSVEFWSYYAVAVHDRSGPQSRAGGAPERLWVEGEHIPRNRLASVFRGPPGVPTRPPRSALIIGSRGAGKTTFLRHLGLLHEGVAVKLSLGSDMASISLEVAKGHLATDSGEAEEEGIVGKTVALAAAWLAERATKNGILLEPSVLLAAVPSDVAGRKAQTLNVTNIGKIRSRIDEADVDRFTRLAKGRALQQFANTLGEACEEQGKGPLLILLDRGDNVVPACLAAVFQLLDQSDSYTAVAAMRPGPSPPPQLVDTPASAAAGDHYDVFMLGARPRSAQWVSFVEESLRAQQQLADGLDRMPLELVRGVLMLSRDSVRVAIEVLGRVLQAAPAQTAEDAALDALEDLAANLQLSAKTLLRQFNPDVGGLFRQLREDVRAQGGSIANPCVLSVRGPRQSLLETTTDVDRFLAVGLRSGAFCLPEGASWAPGHLPLEVEVHPMMLWQRSDGIPQASAASEAVRLSKKSREVLGGGGGPAKASVFCAYRMQRRTSSDFLEALTREVRRHPALSSAGIAVTNGKTDPGERWASTIRNRIKKAKAVVADVTDMRPDVVFEVGFAYGCSTPVVPAVETASARARVPFWLTDMQVAAFSEPNGLASIINRLIKILSDPRGSRRGPPKPAPGIVVWLRPRGWNLEALEQARGTCGREGLVLEIYESPEDVPLDSPVPDADDVAVQEVIDKAARANLLVVHLDGGRADDLMHYVAGAVAARPKTASDGAARRVLVVQQPGVPSNDLAADSLSRVTEVVRLIPQAHLQDQIRKFAQSYNRWANKA